MKTIKGYKFITKDMKSSNGDCTWKLGVWKKHEGKLKLCNSGFHACVTALKSLQFIYGDRWFLVEARGSMLKDTEKFVASEMRLVKEIDVKKVLVPFACACARQCLKDFESRYPKDSRPRKAIEVAEEYIKHPTEANRSAAKSAASAAESEAELAAKSAAWSAASAAWSAASAARSAAESEAELAAKSAASAASAAESEAELAAWSAASAAESEAELAAKSAASAAWSAASAAWSAASEARSAAKEWQTKELERLIKNSFKKAKLSKKVLSKR